MSMCWMIRYLFESSQCAFVYACPSSVGLLDILSGLTVVLLKPVTTALPSSLLDAISLGLLWVLWGLWGWDSPLAQMDLGKTQRGYPGCLGKLARDPILPLSQWPRWMCLPAISHAGRTVAWLHCEGLELRLAPSGSTIRWRLVSLFCWLSQVYFSPQIPAQVTLIPGCSNRGWSWDWASSASATGERLVSPSC